MDTALKELMDIACLRGNKYVKGDAAFTEIHDKMAELGVLLLEKAKKLPELDNSRIKEELIEIQNKLDDMRRSIFETKFQIR